MDKKNSKPTKAGETITQTYYDDDGNEQTVRLKVKSVSKRRVEPKPKATTKPK